MFLDWAGLYQDKPRGSRTDEQTVSFKLGLGNVNLWYCHLLTLTLMNKKLPEGRLIGYDGSGWTVRACCCWCSSRRGSVRQAGRQADLVLIFH